MSSDTVTKFVSQKINKIRWKSLPKKISHKSDSFATGSWDNDVNKLCMWGLGQQQNDDNMQHANQISMEPQLLCDVIHHGDVTDLQFVNEELIFATSSLGNATLFKHHQNSQTLSASRSWEKLHRLGADSCSCTSVAIQGEDTAVTVGEDGRLCVLHLDHKKPIRVIDNADSCSLTATLFLKQSEVAAVNSIGHLKVWDIKQNRDDSARTLHLAGEQFALHCLDKHPTQPHILATGGQQGTLCIWDMRMEKFPVKLLTAHTSDIWEVRFHPTHPDNLFSCSQDGTVWHWDSSGHSSSSNFGLGGTSIGTPHGIANLAGPPSNISNQSIGGAGSSWLASEATKHRMEITDLLQDNIMPVNSLDVQGNQLICGTDGEQIFLIHNLPVS